jgi:hypothetical protein
MGWASDYMQMKTAGHIWNTLGGGPVYALSNHFALNAHPELTHEQRRAVANSVSMPMAARMKANLRGIGLGLGGAAAGALIGYMGDSHLGDVSGSIQQAFSHSEHTLPQMAADLMRSYGPTATLGVLGGMSGALAGRISGEWDHGKQLTEEEIREQKKAPQHRISFHARHPLLSAGGILTLA